MSYDEGNFTIRREENAGVAGGGSTTEYAKFRHFQKMRLKAVHVAVETAGTNTGHGLGIYHGTSSIGAIALSTNAAGYTASSAVLDETVDSLEQVSVKTLVDATGLARVIYEYEVLPDAVQS